MTSIKASVLGGLAAILLSSSAYASDIYGSAKDGPATAASSGGVVSWTGFYIGGSLGYGNANHDLTVERYNGAYCFDKYGPGSAVQPEDPTDKYNGGDERNVPAGGCDSDEALVDPSSKDIANLDGLNSSGLVGDARIGFDIARGRFLFGVFGSYGFNNMETTGSVGDFAGFKLEKDEEWSVGARAGVIVAPRTLAYILAAYTETTYNASGFVGPVSGSKDVDFQGVTVGGGVEFALTQNIFLGVEGTHTFYGEETLIDSGASPVGGFGTRLNDDLDETKVMGTLKFKLNGGGSTGLGF